jgi:hypothetical protein
MITLHDVYCHFGLELFNAVYLICSLLRVVIMYYFNIADMSKKQISFRFFLPF